jgi:hypothetical protein
MKHLKIVGIAAVAAMAFMAVIGAGTASAANTTLCKVEESPCKAENHYAIGTAISSTSSNATLTSNLGSVVCTKSSVGGKTTTTGSSKTDVEGKIESLSFTGCELTTPFFGTKHACTVTSINTPYKAVITNNGGTKGTLTVSSGGTGDPGAKVDCGQSVLRCQFTAKSLVLDALSTTATMAAMITAEAEPLERTVYEGGICPSESKWDATYEVTAPKPLYIEGS